MKILTITILFLTSFISFANEDIVIKYQMLEATKKEFIEQVKIQAQQDNPSLYFTKTFPSEELALFVHMNLPFSPEFGVWDRYHEGKTIVINTTRAVNKIHKSAQLDIFFSVIAAILVAFLLCLTVAIHHKKIVKWFSAINWPTRAEKAKKQKTVA